MLLIPHIGICKVCGKEKELDACGYCNDCYPYDQATDLHKQHQDNIRRDSL